MCAAVSIGYYILELVGWAIRLYLYLSSHIEWSASLALPIRLSTAAVSAYDERNCKQKEKRQIELPEHAEVTRSQTCRCADLSLCRLVVVQTCRCADLSLCRLVVVQTCRCADLSLCRKKRDSLNYLDNWESLGANIVIVQRRYLALHWQRNMGRTEPGPSHL